MKKRVILTGIFFLLLQAYGMAEEVRIYTDYSPVRVFRTNGDADAEMAASEAGLKGKYKVVKESDIPKSRDDRDAWKMKDGAIHVDPVLQKEMEDTEAVKKSALDKIQKAADLTKEEMAALGLGG